MSTLRKQDPLKLLAPNGQELCGVFSHSPNHHTAPVVVYAHGFGSTRNGEKAQALEAECARRNWAFAAVDFRGHGASAGTMEELLGSRLLEDLDLVTREAARRAGGSVFLFGSSMGGWASAWLAVRQPERISACAFVAPAFRFLEWPRLTIEERETWRRTGRHRVCNEFVDVEISYALHAEAAQFRFAALAADFKTPALIFHGLSDELVPYSISLEFAAACTATDVELVLIKAGEHRLHQYAERMARAACVFFGNHV